MVSDTFFHLAARELVEGAEVAVGRSLLIEERELALVELLEELVPLDGLEILVVLVVVPGERDPQQPDVLALPRSFHVRGLAAALLDPLPDLVVVRRVLRFAHRFSPEAVEADGARSMPRNPV